MAEERLSELLQLVTRADKLHTNRKTMNSMSRFTHMPKHVKAQILHHQARSARNGPKTACRFKEKPICQAAKTSG